MKMRVNRIFSSLFAGLMAFSGISCQNSIEDYYNGGEQITSDETLMEYLDSQEEFSTFAALLKETGVAERLSGKDLFTVWAPDDSSIPESVSQMTAEEKLLLVMNHVSTTTIFSRNLSGMSTVKTLAGKHLNVVADRQFSIDGTPLKEVDLMFANGLLHKTGGWMIPQKNIYQWIEELSDDFSMFRDTLRAHDVRIFDKENSPVIGVDETGKIVYDSLWIVKNDLINNVDLADESLRHTMFVPSNTSIEAMLDERKAWFESIEREMTEEDSTACISWIMNAALHKGVVNFKPSSTVTSVKGKAMRTDYSTVGTSTEMSNGRIYVLDRCYAPRDIHYEKIVFNPYWIRKWMITYNGNVITTNTGDYDHFYNGINNANSKPLDAKLAIFWQFSTTAENNAYMFEARSWNPDELVTEDLDIMPGHYTIRARFIAQGDGFNTDVLNIYQVMEDEELRLINQISGVKKNYFDTAGDNGKDGVVCEDWEFTGKYSRVRFRVEIPGSYNNGQQRRICMGEWTLVPKDNY